MHSERRPTHLSVQRTLSDDAASERVCDLTNMPADTRNYAEELAQLQDKQGDQAYAQLEERQEDG